MAVTGNSLKKKISNNVIKISGLNTGVYNHIYRDNNSFSFVFLITSHVIMISQRTTINASTSGKMRPLK